LTTCRCAVAGVSSCCCAAAGSLVVLLRRLDSRSVWSPKRPRPGGWRQRWVEHSGCGFGTGEHKNLRSGAGVPRLLRLLRDPLANAEALPGLTTSAVDSPPVQR
jgi:hypothetical protein